MSWVGALYCSWRIDRSSGVTFERRSGYVQMINERSHSRWRQRRSHPGATGVRSESEEGEAVNENSIELRRRIEALEERLSRLTAAILRVTSSLGLDTVLQEVVDSACTLTGARYGVMATVDEAGQIDAFVVSGFTPEEKTQMAAWPDGPRLFAHFRDLDAPIRLADLPNHVRALGLSANLMRSKTMQGTPMRHGGVHVGNFFLAEKEAGQEFTDADEEVLALFASQAATAIVNARTHRDGRRARADLKALVDTSPMGVVVFDGATGRLVTFNREARRITKGLQLPDRSEEQLLEVITCQRADGREVSLAEFPIAQQLRSGETVRAEEITLSVPDGRSVTTLVNSTPILGAEGAVESVVVTLQDLAPLQELERIRAEFLRVVSHELRAPLISIKGSTATVLGASPAPERAEMMQFFRIIDQQADHMRGLIGDLLDHGRIVTGTLSVSPEPTEIAALVDEARITFQGGGARRALRIELPEDLPRVLADRPRIVQVLTNLFSNAARHSPDSSPIRVSAERDGLRVAISVIDQGRDLPPDQLPHLFSKHAGVVAGSQEDRPHGAGLGLAICRGLVEAHGGRIRAESGGPGRGTRFTFTLPVAEEAAAASGAQPASGRSRPSREPSEQTCILVVDADPQILRYVRDALYEAGFAAVVTGDPEEVPGLFRTRKPKLVLLDLPPGTDGIELMEQLPELGDVPVIFISAYGREETIVKALDAGAADYIVKPFSPSELTARVRAALRQRAGSEPFMLGELTVRYEERLVTVAGQPVELTATEFELLHVLSVNAGTSAYVRRTPAPSVAPGRVEARRPKARARSRQAPPTQVGRRRGQARLHPQ